MNSLLVFVFMAGFIRTLLIILIAYYLIKIVGKLLLPFLISNKNNNYRYKEQQTQQKKEGEVTIETSDKSNSKSNKNKGEYVDFEEVE